LNIFEQALEDARDRAIVEKIEENSQLFAYTLERVERNEGEAGWSNHFRPMYQGVFVYGLKLTVLSPEPFEFEVVYPWVIIARYPYWLEYRHGDKVLRITSRPL
jgi:hypothetical protein